MSVNDTINQVFSAIPGAADYIRTTGISNNPDEYINNFADVIEKGEQESEIERATKVLKTRERQGLDTTAQVRYIDQLNGTIAGGGGGGSWGDENQTVGAAGNFSIGDTAGFGNAINRVIGSVAAGMVASGDGANPLVEVAENGETPIYYNTGGEWTKIALIGGGALIAAAFVKGMLD